MPAPDRNASRALPLIPQMVPSATCVRCDVCCRFPEADSFLRPYFTEQEIIEAVARGIDPAHFPDRRGGQVSLAPNPSGEGFLCPAFDPATSHCRIYEGRPLDCRIYPLAVMWSDPLSPTLSPKGREGGEGRSAIGDRRESSPLPRAYDLSPVVSDERPDVVLGWDTKCPFLQTGDRQSAIGNGPESSPSPIAHDPLPGLRAYADRVAALVEGPYLQTFVANPRLIGRFQDDVVVVRRLTALTARVWGMSERSGKSGTSERKDLRVAPFSPVTPVTGIITRPLTFDDRPRFEAACASLETPLAAYAFAPQMVWRELFTYTWAEVDGHFCLFAEYADGIYMPLPPLRAGETGGTSAKGGMWRGGDERDGRDERERRERRDMSGTPVAPVSLFSPVSPVSPVSRDIISRCFAYMNEKNRGSAVSRIENVPVEWTADFTTMGYRMTAKDPDYLYRTADLAALAGDSYKSQRAACNRVLRDHRCEMAPYRPGHRGACLALFHRWRQQQEQRLVGDVARLLLHDAESAHREALTNPEALGLVGRVVRVDGAVRAYTFGYARSRSVYCVLLEAADRAITGLGQFVFRECCREAATQGFDFINTMDDSGLPHLAASKRAYHPVRLVPSLIATRLHSPAVVVLLGTDAYNTGKVRKECEA